MTGSITPPGGGAASPPPIQNFAQAIAQVTLIPAQLRNQIFAALQTMTLANALANGGQNPQTQVQGQVVGKDQSGATLIKTDAGTVGIRTQLPLPQGANVTLQIGGTQQAPQAVIVQVQPPAPAPAQAQAQSPAPAAAAPAQPAPQPAPTAAQQPATNIAPTAQAAQPSVQATATVVGPPVPQTTAAAQTLAVPQAQVAPQTQTGSNAVAQQTLQTGTSVQVRVVPDTPVPQTTAQQTAAQPAPVAPRSQFVETLTARVVAHTPGGQTLLDSSLGRLAMTWPAGVPRPAEGAQLALQVTVPPQLRAGVPVEPAIRSGVPLAHEWPNLKEALSDLAAADPALARRVVDEALPRPGPRLAMQVLSFLATDRSDARSMLGENVAGALERAGHGDVLQRLDSDLREMQRQATASNEWRATYVPIYDGRDIRQMRLFTRNEGEKGKRDKESKRFIVELDFSELGEVQIDGLMRKPRLELMLRTRHAIPPDMRDEIEVVFLEGCSLAGLAGKIYFQATDRFPVAPLDEIARKDRGVVA
ncbi:MAG: hypothetical protein HY059_13225 [Proteobacteria bacterium]|nr:hypothetical protein [Pseudomonadota bacterium]